MILAGVETVQGEVRIQRAAADRVAVRDTEDMLLKQEKKRAERGEGDRSID